jgi:hypothetical protein
LGAASESRVKNWIRDSPRAILIDHRGEYNYLIRLWLICGGASRLRRGQESAGGRFGAAGQSLHLGVFRGGKSRERMIIGAYAELARTGYRTLKISCS